MDPGKKKSAVCFGLIGFFLLAIGLGGLFSINRSTFPGYDDLIIVKGVPEKIIISEKGRQKERKIKFTLSGFPGLISYIDTQPKFNDVLKVLTENKVLIAGIASLQVTGNESSYSALFELERDGLMILSYNLVKERNEREMQRLKIVNFTVMTIGVFFLIVAVKYIIALFY